MSGNDPMPFVYQGIYIDYGRSIATRNQWLVTPLASAALTNLLAIFVTTALSRLFRIYVRLRHLYNSPPGRPTPWPGHPERTTAEGRGWHGVLDSLHEIFELGAVQLPPATSIWSRLPRQLRKYGLRFLAGLSYLLLFAAFQVCGVVTTLLQTNSLALSAYPDCGTYIPDIQPGESLYNITTPYEHDIQTDSAAWVRNCYNVDGNPDGCSFFLNQSISYSVDNASCPFASDLCFGGSAIPVRFTTGPIDSRTIGINAPKTFEFNRTTICSPLNMNSTYISLAEREETKDTFHYNYGSGEDSAFSGPTWISYRYGDIGHTPNYEVGTLWSPHLGTREWQPLEGLRPPPGASTTIIFVISNRIFYQNYQDDPIFPARDPAKGLPGYYINSAGHGTVLACLDQTLWRDLSVSDSWSPITRGPSSLPSNPQTLGGLWLLLTTLANSHTYAAFSQRLGSALDAQARITGFTSLPLAREQWRLEAEQLFATSLARVQMEARNFARGALARYAGYVRQNQTPDFCENVYMFDAGGGWINLNWNGWICILLLSLAVMVLAVPVAEEELFFEVVYDWAVVAGGVLAGIWRTVKSWAGIVVRELRGLVGAVVSCVVSCVGA